MTERQDTMHQHIFYLESAEVAFLTVPVLVTAKSDNFKNIVPMGSLKQFFLDVMEREAKDFDSKNTGKIKDFRVESDPSIVVEEKPFIQYNITLAYF
jgi:hypothetical protein